MTTLVTISNTLGKQYHPSSCVTCPTCKGTGVQRIKMNHIGSKKKKSTTEEMDCMTCNGVKVVTASVANQWLLEKKMWCRCEKQSLAIFFEDEEHDGCITKHHYHCSLCGLISQIG